MIIEIGTKAKQFGFLTLDDPEKWSIGHLLKVNALMSDSQGCFILIKINNYVLDLEIQFIFTLL